jgi:hypothetical protein
MQSDRITEATAAQQIAAQISAKDLASRTAAYTVGVDQIAMAAAHVRHHWGEYGYSLAVESAGFGWTLFRGHHSDGSDFWFVVDRYCNVADLPREA